MGIKLIVTPEELKKTASEVDARVRTMENSFNTIQSIVSGSAGYWRGSSGDKAREEFRAQWESISLVIRRFREYPPDLLSMAGVYEDAENTNVQVNKALDPNAIP